MRQPSFVVMLASGLYALICIPCILVAEHRGSSEAPFHTTQLLAITTCFVAAVVWLSRNKLLAAEATSRPEGPGRRLAQVLATTAFVLTGLWLLLVLLAFVGFSIAMHDFQ